MRDGWLIEMGGKNGDGCLNGWLIGRSKPATNSQAQAPQHTVWNISTLSKTYRTVFYRNKMSTTRCE